MPSRHLPESDGDDDSWDDDVDNDLDDEASDDDATSPCPYCKRMIYDDAEWCPHCEHYISDEDSPPQRKPWWIIVGVIACLYMAYRWVLMR
jgi:hypothetical protein